MVDDIRERVRGAVEDLDSAPDLERVRRRSRRIRAKRVGALLAVMFVVGVGIALPLTKLMGLGSESSHHPAAQPVIAAEEQVTCDRVGTEVRLPKVRPLDDGVHFSVDNQTGSATSLIIERTGTSSLSPGQNALVLPVPPGTVAIACGDTLGADATRIDVVDTAGIWVSPLPDCEEIQLGASSGTTARGTDLVALTRRVLQGLTQQDQLEIAGYPQGAVRYVRVVRDGRTVAAATFDVAESGFLFRGTTSCPGSGIS